MLNESKNWVDYIPYDDDVQVSKSTDFLACGSYSFIYILQIVLKFKTGLFYDFSERGMAKLSDTQPWGNSLDNIVDAANEDGLLSVHDWPELTHSSNYENINWSTYYADIPEYILKRAFKVKASYRKITSGEVDDCLKVAPLWTIIKIGSTNHIVAQVNKHQYYDSYEIKLKNFQPSQPIVSQYQLLIKPKFMIPAVKRVVFADGKTFGVMIDTPNGTQIIKATSQEQWVSWSKADSYLLDTANADGSPKWVADISLPI